MRKKLTSAQRKAVRREQSKRLARYSIGGREKERDKPLEVTKVKLKCLEDVSP